MSPTRLRYGQCWEDADCLLQALDPRPGALILSIASGGENSLALLSRPGVRVLAIDRNPSQIAALELKLAAFRHLTHGEMLQLLGARGASRAERRRLYQRCRGDLTAPSLAFWENNPAWLNGGLLPVARFERYLALFRTLVLPLVHDAARRQEALQPRPLQQRLAWYETRWDNRRWRGLFRLFFSRASLAALGTDHASVRFGSDSQADQLLAQVRRVMVESDPSRNPYLHWLLQGRYGAALPLALRPELFDTIRSRLDQLQWRHLSLEDWLAQDEEGAMDGFNLSNVLEYVEPAAAGTLLAALQRRARPGARLLLWNRLAPRDTSLAPAGLWHPLETLAQRLHQASQVPFYRRLVVAEALPSATPAGAERRRPDAATQPDQRGPGRGHSEVLPAERRSNTPRATEAAATAAGGHRSGRRRSTQTLGLQAADPASLARLPSASDSQPATPSRQTPL